VYFVFIRPDNILSCHGRWAYSMGMLSLVTH